MTETALTVVGNLVADPELRFTQSGLAVANFRVASTPRRYDKVKGEWVDGESVFLSCTVWRELAEHVSESLTRGTRVMLTGSLRARSYETNEGDKRTALEVEVDEIGPSLRYATARVERKPRTAAPAGDPWSPTVVAS